MTKQNYLLKTIGVLAFFATITGLVSLLILLALILNIFFHGYTPEGLRGTISGLIVIMLGCATVVVAYKELVQGVAKKSEKYKELVQFNDCNATSTPAIINWAQALLDAAFDTSVGIAHAPLAGDAACRLHVTRLLPDAKVKAHRHGQGEEFYIITSGRGSLYTGRMADTDILWNDITTVRSGDTFVISAGTVHQLHNTDENEPLVLIFVCPDSHLAEDREVVADFVSPSVT